jgi:hypothetical protein
MEIKIPIDADHSQIVKFDYRDAEGYKYALEKLNGFVADALKVISERFCTKKRNHLADDADGHPKRARSSAEVSPGENNQKATG